MDQIAVSEDLFGEVQILQTRILRSNPEYVIDPNMLFDQLERHQHQANRIEIVFALLAGDENFGQPMDVLNEPLNHTEIVRNETVVEDIQPFTHAETSTFSAESVLSQEIEMVQQVCKDPNKDNIVSLLMECKEKPNDIEAVIDTLLTKERALDKEVIDLTSSPAKLKESVQNLAQPPIEPQPSTSAANSDYLGIQVKEKWNELREIFPDADPDYLYQTVQELVFDNDKLQEHINSMLETKFYPKLKESIKKYNEEAIKQKYLMGRNFTVEGFLELVDDPLSYYYDFQRPKSQKYKDHVKYYLEFYFPMLSQHRLQKLLDENNYSLTVLYRLLQKKHSSSEPPCKKKKTTSKQESNIFKTLPNDPDEQFYKELAFLYLESGIRAQNKQNVDARNKKIQEARSNDELVTCGCCYDDELLLEEMLLCDEGHMFCHECVRKSSSEVIGQGKIEFPCLAPDCDEKFSIQLLSKALKPAIISKLYQRLQEEEIKSAGLSDLVCCPFCSFCAVMPNLEDKIFKCLNPECLKESCRLCKELNHLPLRCEEVEKKTEIDMRTYIENKMTEALLRTCPKCSKKFIKVSGCNKMVCSCGTIICYVCREAITGYDHFLPGKCPQFSDDYELHVKAIKQEAEKAKKEYINDHPDSKYISLKHDPLQGFPSKPPPNPSTVPEFCNTHYLRVVNPMYGPWHNHPFNNTIGLLTNQSLHQRHLNIPPKKEFTRALNLTRPFVISNVTQATKLNEPSGSGLFQNNNSVIRRETVPITLLNEKLVQLRSSLASDRGPTDLTKSSRQSDGSRSHAGSILASTATALPSTSNHTVFTNILPGLRSLSEGVVQSRSTSGQSDAIDHPSTRLISYPSIVAKPSTSGQNGQY